jgi:hypothetical protein
MSSAPNAMLDARVTSEESCVDKEKAGPVKIAPPGPQVIYQVFQITPSRNNAARDKPADLLSQIKPFRP